MVLLVLALVWVAVLLPPFVRSRLEGNPADSVGRFRRHLRVLQSTSPAASSLASDPVLVSSAWGQPGPSMPIAWAQEARRLRRLRRRRRVLSTLTAAVGTTFALSLIPELRFLLVAHVVADLAAAAYVTLLIRIHKLETANSANTTRGLPVEPESAASVPPARAGTVLHRQAY